MREFIKNNKWKLLVSSLVILLPIAAGLILWDKLPSAMNSHWGLDGAADGKTGRIFVVFGLPLLMLALQWFLVFLSSFDKRVNDQNNKILTLVLFIIPFISVYADFIIYALVFDLKFDILAVLLGIMGLLFILIGNYMPKCKPNHTVGIRIVWTLANDENWYKTHRVAGKVWVIGGAAVMLMALIPGMVKFALFFAALAAMMLIPTVYSYKCYREAVKEGKADASALKALSKKRKKPLIISVIGVAAVIIICVFVMFTGDIEIEFGDTSFTLIADFYDDLTVDYAVIESVEYVENDAASSRVWGFGSARLSLGTYESDTYGRHTRYSYTGNDACIVIKKEDSTLVIGCKDDAATRAAYEEITMHLKSVAK